MRYPRLTAEFAGRVAATIRLARADLAARPVREIVAVLGRAGTRLGDPLDPLRREAESRLPATAGITAPMARAVLDGMAADWTEERLMELVRTDFPDPDVLDGFRAAGGVRVRAIGGELALHLGAGNVPGVGVTSILRSLIVKSPVVFKPGSGDVVLPVLIRRAIEADDPELAAAVAVLYWPGGQAEGESALLKLADPVVVYGGLDTVRRIRERVPAQHAIVAYHHRLGLGVVGRGVLSEPTVARRAAEEVARAVAMFDQRGCVSPQALFIEQGGAVGPDEWAGLLGEALDGVDVVLPQGAPSAEEASAIHQLRGVAEAEMVAGDGVELRTGGAVGGGIGWTIVTDPNRGLEGAWANRTVVLIPIADAEQVPDRLRGLGPILQTAAVTGMGEREASLADSLARAGVMRVVSFRGAPWPRAAWRHDGGDPLRALVRWSEWTAEEDFFD